MKANAALLGWQTVLILLIAASAATSIILAAIATAAARDSSLPTAPGLPTQLAVTPIHSVFTNKDMGIQEYRFPVTLPFDFKHRAVSFTSSELRVYVRLYCSEAIVTVAGFAALIPNDTETYFGPAATYYYRPPTQLRREVNLSFVVTNGHKVKTEPLAWQADESTESGLWPFKGTLGTTTEQMSLSTKGSSMLHPLPLFTCGSSGSSSSSNGGKGVGMVLINQAVQGKATSPGIWNVVTTTSPNLIPPHKIARLLLLHARHHQGLGFTGTILRCNPDEALVLAAMPQLQDAITQARLIIWPWVWDQQQHLSNTTVAPSATTSNSNKGTGDPSKGSSIVHSTIRRKTRIMAYYWQVPKNQLVLLAALGRNMQLAFFDLDEYLVLPQGGTLQDSSCQLQHLDKPCVGWEYVRYAALTANCSASAELDCWEQAMEGKSLGNTAPANASSPAAGAAAGVSVIVAQCPCSQGKTLVQPDHVPNTNVHMSTAVPWGIICRVDPKCSYLLHMQSLMATKRPWGDRRTVQHAQGRWIPGADGVGTLHFANEKQMLKTHEECGVYNLLVKCAQA